MAQKALTEEQMREMVQQFEAGKPVKQLADQYHVSKATAYNIINNYKEHGERAFSDIPEELTAEKVEAAVEAAETVTEEAPAEETAEPETEGAETVENVPNIVLEALIQYKGVMEEDIRDTEEVIENHRKKVAYYENDLVVQRGRLAQLNDYILKVRGGEQE